MSFALSTSWNAFKFSNGKGIIRQIKGAGFNDIELSFSLAERVISDILEFSNKKKIRVISLHNYCPIPEGLPREVALPDCYSLSSSDEDERKRAVHFTKKSIECCAKFEAQVLVLHTGRVEIEDYTRSLIELCSAGLKDTQQYNAIKSRIQQERNNKAGVNLSQAIKSLEELSKYSQKLNIALGLENRFYFGEIPSFDEMAIILTHFGDGNVFYWHDTGHARVAENLGFINSAYDFLERYGARLRGIHLHDAKGCKDHLAPLKGDLDFSKLKPYINTGVLKVIEAHYPATRREVIKARIYLEKVLG